MTLLLIIIYISFISLGLPDSLIGSAWPIMHLDLGVPVASAGIITMIISGGTIISSFFSEKIIRRLGTGSVTTISVALTAFALLGFAFSQNFMWLCVCAIPLGLGAGAVDSALNNFVALHFKAMHMNWLHCFWGIGASLGPVIMSFRLQSAGGWKDGYFIIAIIQIVLVVILLVSLPLWKKAAGTDQGLQELKEPPAKLGTLLGINGAKAALFGFFCYCAIESTTGVWGSTFLVDAKGLSAETAAQWISMFYVGITVGRAASGFITLKINSRRMIGIGQVLIVAGIVLLLLPAGTVTLFCGLFAIGLGCAPIFPAMLHLTPENFGKARSQSLMGLQMACAYVGTTFIPPVFGLIAQYVNPALFPFYIAIFLILMVLMTGRVNKAVAGKKISA